MKILTLPSFVAAGALLPLALVAAPLETHRGSASDREIGPPSKKTWPTAGGQSTQDGSQDPGRIQGRPQGSSYQSPAASASMQSGQVQRIPERELEQRVTASSLMGKRVVDREGQEIGKVKDIGLTAVLPHLRPEATPSGLSGSTPTEARIFVRANRSLDTEGDLVAIPASQLQREGDMLRVDVSQAELRSIIAQSAGTQQVTMGQR